MFSPIVARRDAALKVQISSDRPLTLDGKPLRPGSGLVASEGKLALIREGADVIAVVDGEASAATSVPLRAPHGVASTPLRAVVSTRDWRGGFLLAFGSGRTPAERRVARVRLHGAEIESVHFDPRRMYEALDELEGFTTSMLDLAGAAVLPKLGDGRERLRLFQRGHGAPKEGGPAYPATVDIQLDALLGYLERTRKEPNFYFGCDLENPRQYDLGSVAGVPIAFGDAAALASGKTLFLGTAEMTIGGTDESEVIASVLGVIEVDGSARHAFINEADGEPTMRRAIGIAAIDAHKAILMVTDPNAPEAAATLCTVTLEGV